MPAKILLLVFLLCASASRLRAQSAVEQLARHYQAGVERLQVPAFQFDYQDNLRRIPEPAQLRQQQTFFRDVQRRLAKLSATGLSLAESITADHLRYETTQHLRRLDLELAFRQAAAPVPATGLSALPTPHAWYALYARQYTSTALTPDELYAFGQQQVRRVQGEIRRLRRQLGYGQDSAGFYRYLASENFQLRDTAQILRRYRAIERQVRRHLGAVFADTTVPALGIQPWEGATAAMPPGIYRQGRYDFNFATGRHNTRAMEWIFEHEGIPGHHYQSVLQRRNSVYSPLSSSSFYSGNAEGWGCYVEYLGAQLGLYQQPETELGKWEWDLVRSARVVLDVGIHDRGWTRAQALAYWQANVPGQLDIAEREINRVTTWPAQCLSYKVGAQRIEVMKTRLSQQPGFSLPRFHAAYLALSGLPLEVVERHIEAVYRSLPARG